MNAPQKILELIELFRRNADAYHALSYNEAMVRQEFINPLFQCLGWDMDNAQGYAEAYKDVIHEAAIKIGGATKAPDYCFRIGGAAKFFLGAKRPSVNLKDDPAPAYQLRRYAWTGKLSLSILTDFEEFAVYDCRIKPAHTDKAGVARILYLRYDDFAERWDEIAGVFSREAILKGSFDRYAESKKSKRGTAAVDTAFLQEIESWREWLARNLALRNPHLSQRELNYAVQVTIDRIIFLRMCEDRGVEPYGQLQKLQKETDIYANLLALYRKADDRYNSGLFHFTLEKDRGEAPDTLTPSLLLDDKPLKDILHGLYYPECPYEFSVLSGEILGQVYEQFLGKVIRLTAGHRAVVEDKPEVRKAGGVYYTPTYIVEYIVKQTVGKRLDDKTPKQAAKLRILDPACGSGSFLLGAYQLLLDWHRDRYLADGPKKHTKELYQAVGGVWRLTTAEKKRILLNNLYGVDIDPQAVEVTKLSLLLKVLEGESEQTLQSQLRMFHERALPDLSSNIQCGNSLIGPDFYDGQQLSMFDEEERYRINVFDWYTAFPWLREAGGFDVVIGNPPYGAYVGEQETKYFRQNYKCPANSLDSFILFVERSSSLLAKSGFLGVIIPSGWVSTPSAKPLRQLFLDLYLPLSFVSLPFDVFHGAYIDTVILTAQRSPTQSRKPEDGEVKLVVFPPRFKIGGQEDFGQFEKIGDFSCWLRTKNLEFLITCSKREVELLNKIQKQQTAFNDYVLVKRGIEVYNPTDQQENLFNPQPAFTGTLQRYDLEHGPAGFVSYDDEIQKSKPIEFFSGERILLRQVLSRKLRLQAVLARDLFLTNQSVQSLILKRNPAIQISLLYILGILNSRLLSWFFRNINSVARRDDFPKIIIQQTREMPVSKIDLSNPSDKSQHDRMAQLTEQMLSLHKQLSAAKTPQEQTMLQRQIDATDRQIDRLVYELYGLTEEEIRIVEGANP